MNKASFDVIGAAIEVHRHLGPGFLESVYEEALSVELNLRGIAFQRQVVTPIYYKDCKISAHKFDFLVAGELIVELKAVESILPIHRAQILSYLNAGGFQLGLLINFNVSRLRDGISRMILTEPRMPAEIRE